MITSGRERYAGVLHSYKRDFAPPSAIAREEMSEISRRGMPRLEDNLTLRFPASPTSRLKLNGPPEVS